MDKFTQHSQEFARKIVPLVFSKVFRQFRATNTFTSFSAIINSRFRYLVLGPTKYKLPRINDILMYTNMYFASDLVWCIQLILSEACRAVGHNNWICPWWKKSWIHLWILFYFQNTQINSIGHFLIKHWLNATLDEKISNIQNTNTRLSEKNYNLICTLECLTTKKRTFNIRWLNK